MSETVERPAVKEPAVVGSAVDGPAITRLVEHVVCEFIDHSPANTLGGEIQEPAFCDPLVGYATGADPMFEELKEAVGPGHWTPAEAFATGTGQQVPPEELTVISWVLAQTPATKADNRKEDRFPAERWARNRIFGQQGNDELHRLLCRAISDAGMEAVAPSLLPQWREKPDPDRFMVTSWSERHVAHVAGLGTFGLCDGLITPRGKAIRLGSIVAHAVLPPTPRPYQSHTEYCLFYSRGICGACVKRCPVDSVSTTGRDKLRCAKHLNPGTREFVEREYGFAGYGCGLCQTGVPCESRIPATRDGKSATGGGAG